MSFRPDKIRVLIEGSEISVKEFCRRINVGDAGLQKTIKGQSIPSVEMLEKIADYFHMSTDYFFDRQTNFVQTKVSELDSFKMSIQELMKAKEEIGKLKEEIRNLKQKGGKEN